MEVERQASTSELRNGWHRQICFSTDSPGHQEAARGRHVSGGFLPTSCPTPEKIIKELQVCILFPVRWALGECDVPCEISPKFTQSFVDTPVLVPCLTRRIFIPFMRSFAARVLHILDFEEEKKLIRIGDFTPRALGASQHCAFTLSECHPLAHVIPPTHPVSGKSAAICGESQCAEIDFLNLSQLHLILLQHKKVSQPHKRTLGVVSEAAE